jgi:hypothetical protein
VLGFRSFFFCFSFEGSSGRRSCRRSGDRAVFKVDLFRPKRPERHTRIWLRDVLLVIVLSYRGVRKRLWFIESFSQFLCGIVRANSFDLGAFWPFEARMHQMRCGCLSARDLQFRTGRLWAFLCMELVNSCKKLRTIYTRYPSYYGFDSIYDQNGKKKQLYIIILQLVTSSMHKNA